MPTSTKSNLLTRGRPVLQISSSASNSVKENLVYTGVTTDEAAIFHIEVPGVDPNSLSVSFEENFLKVDCSKGKACISVETIYDTSKITADVKWGLLTLTVPRRQTHSVKINVLDNILSKTGSAATPKKIEGEPNSFSHDVTKKS